MIKDARFQNFQAHKDTKLVFSPGVNVIKGTSAQGKTSIVRALRWALTNRPQGFTFKSHFATEEQNTSLEINFDDGGYVLRERGKKSNEYVNQNGEVFKALRGEVPDEIKEVLQMDDVNLMSQHDPYFMLQDTPGERGRKINAVVNLGVIDEVLSKCAGLIRNTKSTISCKEEEVEKSKIALLDLKHIEPSEVLVQEIELCNRKRQEQVRAIDKLTSLVNQLSNSINKVKEDKNWLKIKPAYLEIQELIYKLKPLKEKYDRLEQLKLQLVKSEAKLKEDVKWLKVKNEYEEIVPLISTSKSLRTKIDRINKLLLCITNAKTMQNSASSVAENKQISYNKLFKKTGVCPLCGNPI